MQNPVTVTNDILNVGLRANWAWSPHIMAGAMITRRPGHVPRSARALVRYWRKHGIPEAVQMRVGFVENGDNCLWLDCESV